MIASSGVMIWVMNDRTTKAPCSPLWRGLGPGNGGREEKRGARGRVVVRCASLTASLSLLIARQGRSARTRDVVGVRACAIRAMRPTARWCPPRGCQNPGGRRPGPCNRPVNTTASSHGDAVSFSRDRHALVARPSASTAPTSGGPDTSCWLADGSRARSHRRAVVVIAPARRVKVRNQPRTVPGGRPSAAAIVRCP